MKIIGVYGSLKKGCYNYRESMGEPIARAKIDGAMYLCGSYPHLYRPEHADPTKVRSHDLEVYEISNESYSGILGMELGAGYYPYTQDVVDIETGRVYGVTIFYTNKEKLAHNPYEWIEWYGAKLFAQ